jgi:hypothetical protein
LGAFAGFLTMASPLANIDGFAGRMNRSSVAGVTGGTASGLAGGKFANGFVTGAFAHLWNAERPLANQRAKLVVELGNAVRKAYGMGQKATVVDDIKRVEFGGHWDFKNRLDFKSFPNIAGTSDLSHSHQGSGQPVLP